MSRPALIIMAAGMGSRFGGNKQMTPVDAEGHPLLDYSMYDARRAGFEKIICVIKREMEADFHEAVGRRVEKYMELRYAFQSLDDLPAGFSVPAGRVKPWGTAHAVMSARELIDAPFAVINADDFFGRHAFEILYGFLSAQGDPRVQAMAGFRVENTLSENGSVARGVCEIDPAGYLLGVTERTKIVKTASGAAYTEDGEQYTDIPAGTLVSMNFWGFQRGMMDEIVARFPAFLKDGLRRDPLKCEYFLPSAVNDLIADGAGSVRVLPTEGKWFGMTYREDLDLVRGRLAALRGAGEYPQKLWEDFC